MATPLNSVRSSHSRPRFSASAQRLLTVGSGSALPPALRAGLSPAALRGDAARHDESSDDDADNPLHLILRAGQH